MGHVFAVRFSVFSDDLLKAITGHFFEGSLHNIRAKEDAFPVQEEWAHHG